MVFCTSSGLELAMVSVTNQSMYSNIQEMVRVLYISDLVRRCAAASGDECFTHLSPYCKCEICSTESLFFKMQFCESLFQFQHIMDICLISNMSLCSVFSSTPANLATLQCCETKRFYPPCLYTLRCILPHLIEQFISVVEL